LSLLASPAELADALRKEACRSSLRARNGVQYVAGQRPPRIGQTPRDLVWRQDKVRLWRYRSGQVRHRPPVLLFPGLVGRSYVLDLLPGSSLVAGLRGAGFDVFLADWGEPDALEASNTFETYALDYLPRVIAAAREEAEAHELHLLAYCMGAMFALALLASDRCPPVRSAVMLAPPVDFGAMSALMAPLRAGALDPGELIDEQGLVPAEVIRRFFQIRRPASEVTQYVSLWQNLWNERALEAHGAMARWLRDHLPFPGVAFRQMVRTFLRENALAADTLRLHGQRVSLRDIRVPILSVIAERDDIVPPAASRPLAEVLASGIHTEAAIPAGHLGLVAGRVAAAETMPAITRWLAEHSDR
jgi:polyhydroxyalkanoate synthase